MDIRKVELEGEAYDGFRCLRVDVHPRAVTLGEGEEVNDAQGEVKRDEWVRKCALDEARDGASRLSAVNLVYLPVENLTFLRTVPRLESGLINSNFSTLWTTHSLAPRTDLDVCAVHRLGTESTGGLKCVQLLAPLLLRW